MLQRLSATSTPAQATRLQTTTPRASLIVLACLVFLAALAAVLLAASLLPAATLVGRFMSATGDARAGAVTQNLIADLPRRLQLAGAGFALLMVLLLVLRRPFERVVASVLAAFPWRLARVHGADWPLGGLIIIAIAARLAFLNQPMRYDEALSFNEFASRAPYYGLSFYPEPNNHLLNTLLMHVAYAVLGNQPWVLRLPALIAGVLLVPATYGLGRLLYGRGAGLAAAGLVAASSYVVEYSTNARGYTLAALCCVTMFALGVVAVRRDSLATLLAGAVVAAAGIYAVPTTVYGVVIACAWLAIELRRSRPVHISLSTAVVVLLLMMLLVALVYLPVVLVSGPEALIANRFVVPLGIGELLQQLPASLVRTWQFWNRDLPLPVVALLVAGCLVATIAELQRQKVPVALLAVGACLALVVVQRVAPFERVWLFLLPLYFVVGAGGLALVAQRSGAQRMPAQLGGIASLVVAVGLAALTISSGSVIASAETGVFPDAEAVATTLRDRGIGPRDAVLTELPASLPELQYYFPRAGLGIDSLVREPSAAERVYVVSPANAQPQLYGRARPVELRRYATAVLYELQ